MPVVPATQATDGGCGAWGFGGGLAINYRRDSTNLQIDYQMDVEQMFLQPTVIGGTLGGTVCAGLSQVLVDQVPGVLDLPFRILGWTLTGLVIGALGRLVLPGRHDISLLATALVGIAASLLGGILADIFDVGRIVQFLVAVALAAIGITLFASSEHRRAA